MHLKHHTEMAISWSKIGTSTGKRERTFSLEVVETKDGTRNV